MIPDAAKKDVYYKEDGIVLLHGDCRDILPQLELESVQCCVTSPPYWGLRDYGVEGQLGLEETPEDYTERMADVFGKVNNVLRPDGTLWLNLGDSYAGSGKGPAGNLGAKYNERHLEYKHSAIVPKGLKSKDLVGIPWRVAFALQADGWYLRKDIIEEVEFYCPCGCGHIMEERIIRYSQDRVIIWHKPNPMPESVTDRPTSAHEYLFLMAKSQNYYYDNKAILDPFADHRQGKDYSHTSGPKSERNRGGRQDGFTKPNNVDPSANGGRNKRSVWTVSTKPFKEAHFAVFPPELIEPCILAGTKPGDIVLDPFSGSGTVGMVCKKYGRRYIGIEINSAYLDLSPERIGKQEILF